MGCEKMSTTWKRNYPVPAKQNPTKSIRGDNSVLTLTGHKVRNTLIRARFSPSFNTGQRFAYSGSAYGDWYIWDLYSGNVVKHYSCGGHTVRDVNWHPYDQQIITCGTTGDLSCWVYNQNKVPHKRKSSRNKNNCKFANSMPTVEANEETLFELRKLAKAGLKYRAQGIFEHHKSSILSRFVGHSDSDTDYDTDESSLFPYDGSYFLVDGTFVDEYYEDMDSDFYPPSDDEYMFDMLGYIPPLTRSQLRQFSHDDETEIITATNNNNTFRSRNSRRPNTRSSAPRKTRQIRSSLQSQQDNAAQTVRRSSRRSKRRPRI